MGVVASSSFGCHLISLSLSFSLHQSPETCGASKTLKHNSRSMASLTRRAMSLAQIPSVRGAASIGQRRGLAGAADHHGSTKVDFWKQPTNPGNWKEEHFVLISLSGWGLLFYSGYKLFTGGKEEKKPVEGTQ
ncbi:hypothetical protein EUTSA_v10002120mg [Eutrema salsugineum]|uniref:Uncharacterized protein n=1 Tax=Eutrema salsugineum TaxID=72664 RepID=V4NUM4_EUTSA|nr:hypothetical protein EUTSA_v10002120mg [Eutrema salsugineum]